MNVLVTGSTGYIGGRLVPPIAVVDFWRVEEIEGPALFRWYGAYPFHALIFDALFDAIPKEAEGQEIRAQKRWTMETTPKWSQAKL
ncbi:MAG: hypothetical protein E4G90_11970 [Gemmatimonadales bacterium]|nr:MAG: hypothetical protein E4G90_11970 [Gemmatimonadales bacterium]